MKKARRHLDVNLVELDQVLDSALEAPLSEADHNKLKDTLACDGGAAGAIAQYGEDQRGGWEARRLKTTGGQCATAAWPRPQWSRGVQWRAQGRYQASEV